jgi:hypothetical protein
VNAKRTGIIAILLMVMFAIAAIPAEANVKLYAEKRVTVYDYSKPVWSPDRYHIGLVYNVPIETARSAYIGGVDQADLNKYAPEHNNVQQWDRRSYSSGKTVVLIPKRYALQHWGYVEQIYLEFLQGQV